MDAEKVHKLKEFLATGSDWEKLDTGSGIFIVKMPASKRFPAKLGVEVVPTSEEGKPIRRKGVYITDLSVLEGWKRVLNNEKLDDLLSTLIEINESERSETQEEPKVGKFEL